MSQVIISIPEPEFWDKLNNHMQKLIDSRIDKLIEQQKPERLESYSINRSAKILKRSHHTVKILIRDGILKTTPDSRILASELEDYLKRSS